MQFVHPEIPLRVAPLIKVSDLEKLTIEEQHFAFAEKIPLIKGEETQSSSGGSENIQYFHGLKYFLQLQTTDLPPVYIFDNHNHALFFWYQHYLQTKSFLPVLHIDQHSDVNRNQHQLSTAILSADQSQHVFHFSNGSCNVGNFIQPALQSQLISEAKMILTEYSLDELSIPDMPYILDIDLDFRAPEMGNRLSYSLAKIKKLITSASLVTIATSPYFLDQRLSLSFLHQMFN